LGHETQPGLHFCFKSCPGTYDFLRFGWLAMDNLITARKCAGSEDHLGQGLTGHKFFN